MQRRLRAVRERLSQHQRKELDLVNLAFIDLKKQYLALEEKIHKAIGDVLSHGNFIMGPEIKKLESQLAEYVGVKNAVSCSSGTDALLLPLMAWGIGKGDAVFTSTFTFIATAEVIALLGATPVFVDIDPETYNIDAEKLAQAVERVKKEGKLKPRAIIPVDLFGLPAAYDAIMDLAARENLLVLEDAAQSFGGVYKNSHCGALGHAAATSFFPAKPLGCYGDGGAAFTDDDELAQKIMSLRVHGKGTDKYDNVRIGLNARLDTLQAAILLVKLEQFPWELEQRQVVAQRYTKALSGLLETPGISRGCMSAWAQYSVQSDKRGDIQKGLKDAGVPTAIYYPKPLHLQSAFAYLGGRIGDCPVAEKASARIFSLPMHPYITEGEQNFVIQAVSCLG
jgi:UDP-2-acetamido-2-deoxy-ribo-hexuluronate aminotransferase